MKPTKIVPKPIYIFIGLVSVGLGFVGLFLPLLPTTPFILLASWCFLKSSKKLHKKITGSKRFGPAIKNWEDHRSISKQYKMIAVFSIFLSSMIMLIFVESKELVVLAHVPMIVVSIFILSRPSHID